MNYFVLEMNAFFPRRTALTYSEDPHVSTDSVGQVFCPEL